MDANLIQAIKFSHLSIVKGTDIESLNNDRGEHGDSYLHLACGAGNEAIVRYLIKILNIDLDYDLSTIRDNELLTPLHYACLEGKYLPINAILEYCVKQPSSSSNLISKVINASDHRGETPLYCACLNGSINCVKSLLNNVHIDINVQSNLGDTALHISIVNNHMNCVELLIQKGADFNIPNKNGKTAKQLWSNSPLSINNTFLFHSKNELIEIIQDLNYKLNQSGSSGSGGGSNNSDNNNNICKNCKNSDLISINESKKMINESIELFKNQLLNSFDQRNNKK